MAKLYFSAGLNSGLSLRGFCMGTVLKNDGVLMPLEGDRSDVTCIQ